jgi:isopentenyldiphosphate isomerase
MEERFDIYDREDRWVGCASRGACHGDPSLIHRTAHVVVHDRQGRMLLQKRADSKDIQPGRWDTAVGGHLALGESYEEGARREMNEELGIPPSLPIGFVMDRCIRDEIESENVRVFALCCDGPFHPQPDEVTAVRFWTAAELDAALGTGVLTPSLEEEWVTLRPDWTALVRRGLAVGGQGAGVPARCGGSVPSGSGGDGNDSVEDGIQRDEIAAHAVDESHGAAAVQGQSDVVLHLPVAHLHGDETAG